MSMIGKTLAHYEITAQLGKGICGRTGQLESFEFSHSPDGKRFLMMKESDPAAADLPRRINIVVNWFEELKQRVPKK